MARASDNPFPSVLVVEGSAPSSPASGDQRVFIDTSDHKLKRVNSSGTVTTIEGGGSTPPAELGFVELTSSPTTLSTLTTWTDIAGLSLTVTVGTRAILLRLVCEQLSTNVSSASGYIRFFDVTGSTDVQSVAWGTVSGGISVSPPNLWVRLNPAAGSRTYKVQLYLGAGGSVQPNASAATPMQFQIVEV